MKNDYLHDALEKYDRIGVQDFVAHELTTTYLAPDRPQFDRYRGRILEVVYNARAKLARLLLVFPMGELGSHLSRLNSRPYTCQYLIKLDISPVLPSSNAQSEGTGIMRFCPIPRPALSFPTEILQICSSPLISSSRLDRESFLCPYEIEQSN